jgi:hypothetical protein
VSTFAGGAAARLAGFVRSCRFRLWSTIGRHRLWAMRRVANGSRCMTGRVNVTWLTMCARSFELASRQSRGLIGNRGKHKALLVPFIFRRESCAVDCAPPCAFAVLDRSPARSPFQRDAGRG